MPRVRIPLIGSFTSRDSINTELYFANQKDQYFRNCAFHVTRNPYSGQTSASVSGRNDFEVSAVPSGASGAGTAIRYWRGHSSPGTSHILTAFGSTNSTIYDGNTSLGAITGQCRFINETSLSGVATALFVSSGNRAYYYSEGGSLLEITDVDFPPKQGSPLTITGNFAVMDGYHFIMTTNGTIWHSDVNSVANWTSTASIAAQEYPDPGVGVARYKNLIAAFSRGSLEFFHNTGNATGSVLSRVQNLASKIGCVSQAGILEFGDTLYWIGYANGVAGVYVLDGYQPRKVSTPQIDAVLVGASLTDTLLNMLYSWGRSYIGLAVEQTGVYFVYDPELQMWHEWSLTDNMTQSDAPGGNVAGMFYVGDEQTKYLVNSASVAPATVQTSIIDFGNSNRKALRRIRVVGDRTSSTMNVAVSWSDDDYASFSTPRNVDMSLSNPQLMRCGVFRRRAFKLSNINEASADRLARLEAIELDYEECAL